MTGLTVTVIIPAHDEAGYIDACLATVLASEMTQPAEIIVVANACADDTAARARAASAQAVARGWSLHVIETPVPGKLNALNLAEAAARGGIRVYLDADVLVSPPLLGQLAETLATDAPRYASGRPEVTARSGFTRAYARFWQRLPFVAEGVPGFGLFAVNRAGRARWGAFPEIISDDTFVRLSFTPRERVMVAASYQWPMIEGFANLVRVRRRQDRGVAEIAARFPAHLRNETGVAPGTGQLLAMALRDPVGFAAYAAVKLAVRTPFARGAGWARGR